MTQSLPARTPTSGAPPSGAPPEPRGAGRILRYLADLSAPLSFCLMPLIPDIVKKGLLGGRSITIDGNTLDTTLQFALAGQRLMKVGGLVASDDVATARARLHGTAEGFVADLPVDVSELSIPGPAGPLAARLYRPRGRTDAPAPLLVYYHGGGFVIGDLDVFDPLCSLLSHDGDLLVLSIDYRLAPEHPAPAAADDAYAALLWAQDHAAELGADPARIAVGGDSAGGNLAAGVSQRARNEGSAPPALQLLLYPMTNMLSETRSKTLFADGFFLSTQNIDWFHHHTVAGGDLDPSDPVVSPLLADDLSGLPPALVVVAGFDPLRDEGIQYAEAMRAAGVVVDLREEPSMMHAFANFFPLGGGSATAMADVLTALRTHLTSASGTP